ncbi:hypothetical protein ABEY57_17435 [Bacillus tropicus]|uniref:hypothetical protein n=1 Tax=Bacillus tropicus TaxID=2026188 RepID=UPI003D25A8B2
MAIPYYVLAHKYKEDVFYNPAEINNETPYYDETQWFLTKDNAEKCIEENELSDYMVMDIEICTLCNKAEDDCLCGE